MSKYQVRWWKLLDHFLSKLCWGMSLTPYILSGIADMRLKQWLRTQILTVRLVGRMRHCGAWSKGMSCRWGGGGWGVIRVGYMKLGHCVEDEFSMGS